MLPAFRHLVNILRPTEPGRADDKRLTDRHDVCGMGCSGGRVVDFSPSGMRIETRRRWRPGKVRRIKLYGRPFSVTVDAEAVWSRREGFLRHLSGVKFVGMSVEDADMVRLMYERHAVQANFLRAG